MDLSELWGIGIVAGAIVAIFVIARLVSRGAAGSRPNPIADIRREMAARTEALFKTSFPELQPHFHPARVHEFVKARIARKAPTRDTAWLNPPGFPAAAAAEIALDGLRDKVRLLDEGGAKIAEFIYEEHPEGGVVRYGKGKFTVNVKGAEPRVRYWHPQREFKWTPTSWKISSGVSDSPLESSRSDSSGDSSSSWTSSSSTATAAAVGAGIVAAGGSFDGGGASQSWGDGGGSGSSSSSSSSDFGNVESGSSSTSSSTTY